MCTYVAGDVKGGLSLAWMQSKKGGKNKKGKKKKEDILTKL